MQTKETTSGTTPAARSACTTDEVTAIKVAVRARPLVPRERLEGAQTCIRVEEHAKSVVLGSQRQFAFDAVFDQHSTQDQVYDSCVADLVSAVVEGYNATVLAYGPTGSGKTYTMGTGSALHCMEEQQGIIPRVIRQLFDVIQQSSSNRKFAVRAQFLEIYNEELRDLLAPPGIQTCITNGAASSSGHTAAFTVGSNSSGNGVGPAGLHRSNVTIRECSDGQIIVTGAREEVANSYEGLVQLLDRGALARATGATSLNEQSSRSHAIFTIIVEQRVQNSGQQEHSADQQAIGSPASSNALSSTEFHSSNSEHPLTPRARLLQQLQQGSGLGTMSGSKGCSQADRSSTWSSSSSIDCLRGGLWDHSEADVEYRCAKFHLVDLAGSERTKRSGAVGARLKETVTINQGLLALGNVICALGDDKRRWPGRHVPYRDSKLTRLLQDSLGGNSKTVMIACISSADDVMEETLNTLKYASRARNIRNKPVINCQRVIGSANGTAADVQALQLLLLRRFVHQALGPLPCRAVPEVLLADVQGCDEAGRVTLLRELQSMAAMPAELVQDMQQSDQGQYGHSKQHQHLNQQFSGLGTLLISAGSETAPLEAQLAAPKSEKASVHKHAAADAMQQQLSVQQQLLTAIEELHLLDEISTAARSQLSQQVQKLLSPALSFAPCTSKATMRNVGRRSVQSYPLPALEMSICDEATVESITAASAASRAPQHGGDKCDEQHLEALQQELLHLKQQLGEVQVQLQAAQQDLLQDEDIFAERVMEIARLRDQMAAMAAEAEQDRKMAAHHIQCLQAELQRWRTRALALNSCKAYGRNVVKTEKPQTASQAADKDDNTVSVPASVSLAHELSFAAEAGVLRQQEQQPAQHGSNIAQVTDVHSPAGPVAASYPASAASAAGMSESLSDHQHVQTSLVTTAAVTAANSVNSRETAEAVQHHTAACGPSNLLDCVESCDEVVYDDELASYISDTDYTELKAEASQHLLAELQAVLAEKAALEEERAAAQAEAAAAQRSFERSRALLESRLTQLSAAISSQERLICTLQVNESEARQAGALYLERCRELETELAKLQLDLEELTAALARVEADAAASKEEKKRLRTEYELRIQAVVEQMTGLQKQIKSQGADHMDRERQRTSQQVQVLQTQVAAMRAEQEALHKRLQDKLLTQEKAAADKSKEFAALKRAAETAQKRVAELEMQNRRQRAELQAKDAKVSAAHKQLQRLAIKSVEKVGLPACISPRHNRTATRISSSRSSETMSVKRSSSSSSTCSRSSRQGSAAYAAAGASVSRMAREDQLQPQLQQQLPAVIGPWRQASHNATSESVTCNSRDGISTWLKTYLQLLSVQRSSAAQLLHMQAQAAGLESKRDALIVSKAQLDLKQLRKGSSSGGSSDKMRLQLALSGHDVQACGGQQEPEGLDDQLDAAAAGVEHLQQQMQMCSKQASAASKAIAQLGAQMQFMAASELSSLLQQAMELVSDRESHWHTAETKVKKLQLELTESQQQLEEASSSLQDIKLQQQTQLANLQADCEQHVTALLTQLTAAATSGNRKQLGCGKADEMSAVANPNVAECLADPEGSLQQHGHSSIAATITAVFDRKACASAKQRQPSAFRTGGDSAAVPVSSNSSDIKALTISPATTPNDCREPATLCRPESAQVPGPLPTVAPHLRLQDEPSFAAGSMQPGPDGLQQATTDQQQQLPAVTEQADPVQIRLSSRQASPERGPRLSELVACLARKADGRQPPPVQSPCTAEAVPEQQPDGARATAAILRQSVSCADRSANPGDAWSSHQSESILENTNPTPSYPQTGDGESSPSKLQAKLAAYRHHLQQATALKSASRRSASPVAGAGNRLQRHLTSSAASQSTGD